jgi:hypothetical protein
VRGLSLTSFTVAVLLSSDDNTLQDNWIGVGFGGVVALNGTGVQVNGNANTIGRGNVISNNELSGVSIAGSDNVVAGNLIGLDPAGTSADSNFDAGVSLEDAAARNRIGGTDPLDRNVISGNQNEGIRASGAVGTVILGNYIGTDATGAVAIGNATGIRLDGSPTTIGGTRRERATSSPPVRASPPASR